jgi:hypothetical protein
MPEIFDSMIVEIKKSKTNDTVRTICLVDLRSLRVKVEKVCGKEKSQMLTRKRVLKLVGKNLFKK